MNAYPLDHRLSVTTSSGSEERDGQPVATSADAGFDLQAALPSDPQQLLLLIYDVRDRWLART
jgi:hypothetical protein